MHSWTNNLVRLVVLMSALMQCDGRLRQHILTVTGLMNFINDTSGVYVPPVNQKIPELLITAEEEIRRAGYPVEVHRIYAEDGQMLTLHRIPGPSWSKSGLKYNSPRGQPVLIMHGFLGSSQVWIQLPEQNNLPYILADEGYDVWLGNFRCNYYSRSHLKYSTKDRRFWDVSPHEMGVYDVPAFIDHILRTTGYPQIVYMGHSMATTNFLIMASMRPEYNSKIMAAFLLSPVALTIRAYQLNPLLAGFLLPNADLLYKGLTKLRLHEIFPRNEHLYRILMVSCRPGPLQPLCLEIVGQSYGEHRENVNVKEFGRLIRSLIAGTSIKVAHFLSQLFNTGQFRMYDYGPKMNLYKYGSSVPPDYPLDRVTAPIYMYYGLNDVLMTTESMKRLARALPNVIHLAAVEDPKFTHLDFLYGNNAKDVLYDQLLGQINALTQFDIRIDQFGS